MKADCTRFLFALSLMAILASASSLQATTTVTASDSGFVTIAGGSSKGDGTFTGATYNYSVGWELHYSDGSLGIPAGTTPIVPMDRKNYFVFDLSSVTTTIVSATFVVNAGVYESSDPTETLDLFAPGDMGAAIADTDFLLAENLGPGTPAFNEPFDPAVGVAAAHYGNVTAGPPIGSVTVSAADDGLDLSIPIAPAFLNSFLGGKIVFGGELTTLTATGTPEAIMGFTDIDIPGGDPLTPSLVLTLIPVPATLSLMATACCLICLRRKD